MSKDETAIEQLPAVVSSAFAAVIARERHTRSPGAMFPSCRYERLFVDLLQRKEIRLNDRTKLDAYRRILLARGERQACLLLNRSLWAVGERIAARSAALDALCVRSVHRGIGQIVQLGVGLQCRALRLRTPVVRWFDNDDRRLLAFKWRHLRDRGVVGFPEFAPADFSDPSALFDSLSKRGFSPDVPSLFCVEGSIQFISETQATHLLRSIAERVSSVELALDHFVPGAFEHPMIAPFVDYTAFRGAPFGPTFDLSGCARALGWRVAEESDLGSLARQFSRLESPLHAHPMMRLCRFTHLTMIRKGTLPDTDGA